ncbi:MAG: bifunctional UDP-N-acetylglucosamine diphosphorylase/glucosamine-1-phosphate N-acetyltransferase GlmU [Chloroflexi bacterium]|nr:bifunctional UDP-N-acetylglucosamine diphosphorylase/glucosamine-1-phosphate N-acetyltransferase GlmU [Chloroflexota bacterium]MCY3937636.1 bifunctional UDP-N-acetylglucosamine diphosphorylase/glucosamine-1-phosphate N-acetyltransferase GlmU [Chloroflexota bacterium]
MVDESDRRKLSAAARASAVILAAGHGTRMKSKTPKPLHTLAGRTLVGYPLKLCVSLSLSPITVVAGNESAARMRDLMPEAEVVEQGTRGYGTGYAAAQAAPNQHGKSASTFVLFADTPLLTPSTVVRMLDEREISQAAIVVLSAIPDDPARYGRVLRDGSGKVKRIVEAAGATADELGVREINTGIVVFDSAWLWRNISRLTPDPAKGETLLTDLVAMAIAQGREVECLTLDDPLEGMGCDDRIELARAERIIRTRKLEELMLAGVTVRDPQATYVDDTVQAGRDTEIQPGTFLRGNTVIDADCSIGPATEIVDSTIGKGCVVRQSVVKNSRLGNNVTVGPFSHIRQEAVVGDGAHIGNYAEIKNSRIGADTLMGHFGYLGDADVGDGVNIGAGAVTCNFDGRDKHRTLIGNHAFVGSGAMLVAPISVGRGATIGAGSVVTRDIPDGALSYGVPARLKRIKPVDSEDEG